MNPKLEALFDEPEKEYLRPDELNALSQFVSSLPDRIGFYRRLRDEEIPLMQAVADALQAQLPQESEEQLKRTVQNGVLTLRYAAMAMLMDDAGFVRKRLQTWLPDLVEAYGTLAIDQTLHRLLRQQLSQRYSAREVALIAPGLDAAEALLSSSDVDEDDTNVTSETLVGLF